MGQGNTALCVALHASASGPTFPWAMPTEDPACCWLPGDFQEEYSTASAIGKELQGKLEPFSSFVPSMHHSKETKRLSLDKYEIDVWTLMSDPKEEPLRQLLVINHSLKKELWGVL